MPMKLLRCTLVLLCPLLYCGARRQGNPSTHLGAVMVGFMSFLQSIQSRSQ